MYVCMYIYVYMYIYMYMYRHTFIDINMHIYCLLQVLKALQVKYGTLYRQDNVVLSGTHTHGGPAGYFQYTLFIITSKGYVKPAVKALVDGIVQVCV